MNVIDHAILIPASPTFIWRFLGDISQNSTWQEDCTNVSFLTTQHEGRGTRWRYTTQKGKDVVIEITAWYDTLGYEYSIVDGASVGENKGRVRLQEIAEGTLVQWTFNYELDGMLSGLRNSMGLKRNLTNNIQDSLRNLYKQVQNETGGISTHEAKALLKEAPDVEERSSYQPRHPSNFTDEAIDADTFTEPDYPSEQSIAYNVQSEPIPEPPIGDDDTKPNPVIQGTEEIPVDIEVDEPSFLHNIPEPKIPDEDTKPHAVITDDELISTPEPVIDEQPLVDIEPGSEPSDSLPQPDDVIVSSNPGIRDTSTVSVFELFGLQKPSKTQEMTAISDEDLAKPEVESDLPATPLPDIIAEELDETPEIIEEPPAEPIIPPDTGSLVEVESVDEEIDTSQTEAKSTVEIKSVKAEIVAPPVVVPEPDSEPEIEDQPIPAETSKTPGLRATLRHKLIQLRTR